MKIIKLPLLVIAGFLTIAFVGLGYKYITLQPDETIATNSSDSNSNYQVLSQSTEQATITVIPISPTLKPKTTSSDPPVDCRSDDEKSKSSTPLWTKKSVCNTWVDCHVGDRTIRGPKNTCDSAQAKLAVAKQQYDDRKNLVSCQLRSGWKTISKDECIRLQDEWRKQIESQTSLEYLTKIPRY